MAPALLKKDVPALCIECHDVESERARTAHGGYAIAESRCTGCHDPHASAGKKLVADRAHPPFGDRDCSTCHLPPGEKRAKARTKTNLVARAPAGGQRRRPVLALPREGPEGDGPAVRPHRRASRRVREVPRHPRRT